MTGDWQDQAACAGKNVDTWYPGEGINPGTAKRVCQSCPVRAECLEHALATDERFGVWGGMTVKQRDAIRARTGQPRVRRRPHRDSRRHEEVIRMTAEGKSITEIAAALGISKQGVSYHRNDGRRRRKAAQ